MKYTKLYIRSPKAAQSLPRAGRLPLTKMPQQEVTAAVAQAVGRSPIRSLRSLVGPLRLAHASQCSVQMLFHLKILQNSESFDKKKKQDRMPGSCYIVL
jgi:hypothetical protein